MNKHYWMLILAVLLVILISIGFIVRKKILSCGIIFWNNPDCSESLCLKRGGKIINTPFGIPGTMACYFPPKDAGKVCLQDSDCERYCLPTKEVDRDGYVLGRCGDIHCGLTIQKKTKDFNQLIKNSCAQP